MLPRRVCQKLYFVFCYQRHVIITFFSNYVGNILWAVIPPSFFNVYLTDWGASSHSRVLVWRYDEGRFSVMLFSPSRLLLLLLRTDTTTYYYSSTQSSIVWVASSFPSRQWTTVLVFMQRCLIRLICIRRQHTKISRRGEKIWGLGARGEGKGK